MKIICLLRGINVGGNHKMKMDALRTLFVELGYRNSETYIQSGNLVFEAAKLPETGQIEQAIEARFGFHSDVILRSAAEWREMIEHNPFASRGSEIDPARLLVTFLSKPPAPMALQTVDLAGEEAHLRGRELYIYFHNGAGKTKLKFPALARALGEPGTARNWNSVLRLAEMAEV